MAQYDDDVMHDLSTWIQHHVDIVDAAEIRHLQPEANKAYDFQRGYKFAFQQMLEHVRILQQHQSQN